MARYSALLLAMVALLVLSNVGSSGASVGRKLHSYYPGGGGGGSSSSPSSGSSPISGGSPSSGSSPSSSSPYPSSPSSGSSPTVVVPPVTSTPTPTPVISTPTPVTSTPSSGKGSCDFWKNNPGRVPKVLSLLSSLAKIFGPKALQLFGKHLTLLEAIKATSTDPMSALAREGSASLINSYAYSGAGYDSSSLAAARFPLSAREVFARFDAALDSPDLAAQQALQFQRLNEAV